MNNANKLHGRFGRRMNRLRAWCAEHQLGRGAMALVLILAALSALTAINFSPRARIFLAGEMSGMDIIADRGFMVEDRDATNVRREQIKALQPLVFDIVPEAASLLRDRAQTIFTALNEATEPEQRELIRTAFMDDSGREIPLRSFLALEQEDTQAMITGHILPWLEERLMRGVAPDIRQLLSFKGGVLVRDSRNGTEELYPEPQAISDVAALEADLAIMVKALPQGNMVSKRAAITFLGGLLAPSLSPNYEATKAHTNEVLRAVEPIRYHVEKGEIIVRQGERVDKEQQLKIQALTQRKSDRFNSVAFAGTFLFSLLLASGLFFSPSGKKPSAVRQKDLVFIGVLVASFALMAKGLVLVGQKLVLTNTAFSPDTLAFLVPVAGAAGLAALVFSTRRYVVTGLLLAFFCSIMFKASLPLFLFYFLAAMWNTWLICRTQSRQDVVASILILLGGLLVMWAGATLMQGGDPSRYIPEALSLISGGILSMMLVFALAPLVEWVFGYSTRFKLMELMNLDQPIMRELMLKAPGTYHHALIVSHMVEAAAKAIGAQSMLCKVAALYHDIGKITRPDYFIENQAGRENPHDRLAPSMSALILTSHVKKGVELAQAYRLGHEVIDIIRQHHGTGVISFFYRKAQDAGDNPNIADYSYPGPKPQTREAALVLLADVVEASSRTLDDPTPSRLQSHIDAMTKMVFESGQMDEADLTLRDLSLVSESFLRVMAGIFHHRIKYPEQNGKSGDAPAHPSQPVTAPPSQPATAQTDRNAAVNALQTDNDGLPPQ